jgi:FAD/FMN-containing dehydrogenase
MSSSHTTKQPRSWGRYPNVEHTGTEPLYWRSALPDLSQSERTVLPYGYGRSYGDSCLNEGGILLDTRNLNRFISFDEQTGVLCCESGVALADILEVMVPRGWFIPVSPGTKFVSVGGAIANDVHGKNHHRAGTFGCHVVRLKLLRSNGERLVCSPEKNADLFAATIGGLGLTGLILWAEIRLRPIVNPLIDMQRIRFSSLAEFMELSAQADQQFEYTVSWVDLLVGGNALCRGLFMCGNHDTSSPRTGQPLSKKLSLTVPFDFPSAVLNPLTVKAFNELYYHAQLSKKVEKIVSYEPFFYPLDAIDHWNRMYGKRGFLQYQFVVPFEHSYEAMKEILGHIRRSGEGSFLTVLKQFGNMPSPGMLSFPRPGLTLALDFAFRGQKTLCLLDDLDEIVRQSNGAVYPAKDARMSAENFQAFFPRWREFAQYVDPHFSSSLWRRVQPAEW